MKYTLAEIILILSFHPKIGAKTILGLYEHNLLLDVFNYSQKELVELGLPQKFAIYIEQARQYSLKDILIKLTKYGIGYITFLDKNYPSLLKEIPDKPVILFYKGDINLLNNRLISIVGSRKFTNYAQKATQDLVKVLVDTSLVVVSGLALGIDSIAHQAALDNNIPTIAVLGNGLHTIYPANHARLASDILKEEGLILSEFPPESEIYPGNFPMRNRIIAGLSEAVVIAQASLKSGSLITAKLGLDYNREVMVIPYNWDIENGRGGNHLIREGASILTKPTDVLDDLSILSVQTPKPKMVLGSKEERLIYAQFKGDPIHINDIIKVTGLATNVVGSAITIMEMNGLIRHSGGNIYTQMV